MPGLTSFLLLLACFVSFQEDALTQADRLMKANRVEAAEQVLQEELKQHPDSGRVRYTLARIIAFDGRFDEAVKLLRKGITDEADDPTRYNLLVLAGQYSLMRAEGSCQCHVWNRGSARQLGMIPQKRHRDVSTVQ